MIKKRCVKCGTVALYKTRERKCKHRPVVMGRRNRYCCWGTLERTAKAKPKTTGTPQDIAKVKLAHAQRMVVEKITAMKRLATLLSKWTRQTAYYGKRASMTDAEIEAERVKRNTPKPRKRRGVKLEGELHG